MKRATQHLVLLIVLTAVAACGGDSIEPEPPWLPPGAGGKADSINLILGSSIPSQHVDPNALYFSMRDIGYLSRVLAIDDFQRTLAERVDGIIDSLPQDNRLHVAELVRMESPGYIETLFPAELAALPEFWKLLEVPNVPIQTIQPIIVPPFDFVDQTVPPGGLTFAPKLITTLELDLQVPARRLQLVYDGDADPLTVELADVEGALAATGPWTAGDLDAFEAIGIVIRGEASTDADAVLDVPKPGDETVSIATLAAAELSGQFITSYREGRSVDNQEVKGWLKAGREFRPTVTIPSNGFVVLLHLESRYETVCTDGRACRPKPGESFVELWNNGTRVSVERIDFPSMEIPTENVNLSAYLDYTLTVNGTPLVRNVQNTGRRLALFTWDEVALPIPPNADPDLLTKVNPPVLNLPPGRYELEAATVGTVHLDIYPQRILFMSVAGQDARLPLHFRQTRGASFRLRYPFRAVFTPATNELVVEDENDARLLRVIVDPRYRIL